MVVSSQRKKDVTELWQVVCLIFHTYLEYVVQTVEKSEKRYVPTLPFPEKIFLFSLSNLKTAASVMSSVRPILVSPHTLIRGTVSADVYRRPSIKTVYEPMPDDRPRCSLRVNSSWFFLSAFCFPIHPQGTGCSFFQATGWELPLIPNMGRIICWSFAFLVILFLEAIGVAGWNIHIHRTVSYTAVKDNLISKDLDISLSPLRSTMSILRRNTGAKVLPSDIDEVREAKSGNIEPFLP